MKKLKLFYLLTLTLWLSGLLLACGDLTPTAAPLAQAPILNLPPDIAPTSTPQPTATPPPTAAPTPTLAPNDTPLPAPTPTPTPDYPKPALNIPQVGATRAVPEFTGTGQVTERDFYSNLLKKTVPYRIYLPKDYDTNQERYPVLYMLHGYSGKVDEWMWYGIFDRYEELLAKGAVKPFIIVLVFGEQEYFMDHPDNGAPWGRYVAQEVVAHIDGNYRTIPLKESRAIGGLSMGGNGALQISMNYPDIFGVVGAHSPTMRTYAQKIPWWGDQAWFLAHDPITLAKTSQYITQVKLWIDDADNDTAWRPRVLELKQVLDDRGINYTWRSWPGDHNADYWKAHVADYLQWYSSVLDFKR